MTLPFRHLPFTPGLPPPRAVTTLVGGTALPAQTPASGEIVLQIAVGGTPTQILTEAGSGRANISLMGGGPVWVGPSSSVTPTTGRRLSFDDDITISPLAPTWAVGINNPDIPASLVEIILTQ